MRKNQKDQQQDLDGQEFIFCSIHRKTLEKQPDGSSLLIQKGQAVLCSPDLCAIMGGAEKFLEWAEEDGEELKRLAEELENSSNELSATIEAALKNLDTQEKQ